jgi:hypothetical protein
MGGAGKIRAEEKMVHVVCDGAIAVGKIPRTPRNVAPTLINPGAASFSSGHQILLLRYGIYKILVSIRSPGEA